MDNVAHTLIGIGVARAGFSRKYGPGATLTLAIASNLPDIDVLWAVWDGWDRFMLRRTHSHALVALPVLAAALALLVRTRHRQIPWGALAGMAALGVALHLLFDLVNSFGVVLLWPFSWQRYELASIFIVDLAIWGLMAAPLVAGRFLGSERSRLRLHRGALAALGLYALLCGAGHLRAEAIVSRELARRGARVDAVRIFPEPFGPLRFRAAVREGNAWTLYLCRVPAGQAESVLTAPTHLGRPPVEAARASEDGRKLEWFMAAPVWTLLPDGSVEVYDLRFRTVAVARGNPFVAVFPPGETRARIR